MAFTCGFFNSENGDRKYNAEQMSAIFDGIIADGVFTTIGDHMAVTAGTGMQVLVGTGKAWFDHTWNVNDAAYPLTIAASDVTLSRIDAIVLETNHSDSVRLNKLRVVQGTVASSPVKPTLTNSEKVHQHPLAWVTVAPGVTQIAASAIENAVGTSACPFVTGIIATTDIDDLFAQWNGEFDEWFDNLKAQLSDNVVANLQKQIDEAKTAQHTIISDKTATDLGIAVQSSTDAALQNLSMVISMIKLNKGGINLTVLSSGGNPVPGVRVSGILDVNGNELETDSNGKLSGYMNEGSVTLAITGYADIVDYSESITVVKGNIIDKTITVTVRNFLKISSSKSVKFSGNVNTIDYGVGAGGSGGAYQHYIEQVDGTNPPSEWQDYGGNFGGSGGDVVTIESVIPEHHLSYSAIVGSGGGGGGYYKTGSKFQTYHASAGGNSSFMGTSATGGQPARTVKYANSQTHWFIDEVAKGNGNGARIKQKDKYDYTPVITNPTESVKTIYTSFTETSIYGGGGGAHFYVEDDGSVRADAVSGRTQNGGYCVDGDYTPTRPAGVDGLGGGGCGSDRYSGDSPSYLKGGDGAIAIRMHLKTTS